MNFTLWKYLTWVSLAVPLCLFFVTALWWVYSAIFLDYELTIRPFLFCMCSGFGVLVECVLAKIIFG